VSLTATCLRAQCADTSEASTPRIAGALQVAGIRAHALLGVGYSVDQTTLRQLAEATDAEVLLLGDAQLQTVVQRTALAHDAAVTVAARCVRSGGTGGNKSSIPAQAQAALMPLRAGWCS
jgi:hypothetical protein